MLEKRHQFGVMIIYKKDRNLIEGEKVQFEIIDEFTHPQYYEEINQFLLLFH